MNLFLTICVAVLGGLLGIRLRIPAGAMIGAMLAVALLNIGFEIAYVPAETKFYTQIATGAYIGAKITKEDAKGFLSILKPAVILVVVMLTYAILVGMFLCRISQLDLVTALFCMAPGGVTDMTLISMDFDAESSVVALIQSMRMVSTVCLLPPLIKFLAGHSSEERQRAAAADKPAHYQNKSPVNLALTLLVGLLTGGLGKLLGVPGGAIAFSMIGCVIFNIATDRGYMPLNLRRFIQMFAGALIGCTIGRPQVFQMVELRFVILIAVISFLLLDLIAASVIRRAAHVDTVTALFACSPGGLTDMTLIAEEMGADSLRVVGMHTVRLMSIVALYPTIIHLLLTCFGS